MPAAILKTTTLADVPGGVNDTAGVDLSGGAGAVLSARPSGFIIENAANLVPPRGV